MATILIACRTPGKTKEVEEVIGPGHDYICIRRLGPFLEFLDKPYEKVHVIVILASITHWQSSNTTKILKALEKHGLLGITIARSSHDSFRTEVASKGLSAIIDDNPASLRQAVEQVLITSLEQQSIH